MDKFKSLKIKVFGIVQGIGFRPHVYRLAKKHNINGTVRNLGGRVEIIAQPSQNNLTCFINELPACEGCEIINIETEIAEGIYTDFRIIDSDVNDEISMIPPDLNVCPKCQAELYKEDDRRFENPFISCMSCGPRYSIINSLPYDRQNTAMKDFAMCENCENEYTSPQNRRFHAQTISCNDCGPYLIMGDKKDKEAIEEAVSLLNSGKIIAVKGIGGYNYACSPFTPETVQNLRRLKGREEKPFAVMFPSAESAAEYCELSNEEEKLLCSKAAPIVLLYSDNDKFADSVNMGSQYCGAFIPYTPLQMLLTKNCGPLIMTSANFSGQPIIKDDEKMLSVRSPYLSGVLYNKRRILRSVDDSVTKVAGGKPQIIRRSRGYVPAPVFLPQSDKQIMALGGDLKAAFCLYKGGAATVSQYFGDLEEPLVFEEYKRSALDLTRLLKIKPDFVLCDMHPNYYSSGFAKALNIPVFEVQHHHAHVASVMAEHGLSKVIGIAFDGTGYGTDGNIWGGEFLVCDGGNFTRAAHLKYTPILGGDSSMRDAKKTAVCYMLNAGLSDYIKDERKDLINAALKNQVNTVLTSSMGRLFDAVCAVLNIQDENRYEGQCAAALEKEAVLAIRNNIKPAKMSFKIDIENEKIIIDTKPIFEALCEGASIRASLALGFHYAVSDMILEVCGMIRKEQNICDVALCGGVFQNTVLSERTLKLLEDNGFSVYCNMAVPPNDGSISLGQTYIGLMR